VLLHEPDAAKTRQLGLTGAGHDDRATASGSVTRPIRDTSGVV
jgi:hypothetical protein